jgi:AcrR family transcriptional regulator
MNSKRTQGERTAATRAALIGAARELFARDGYAAVGTPAIAAAAGVTRGALYHQFADKTDLFRAVLEAVETDVTARLGEQVVASGADNPAAALRVAITAWLDACEEPEVRRIILIDGPGVLGYEDFRAIILKHGLGLTEQLLQAAMDADQIANGPTRALAHVFVGALDEAALYAAGGADERAEAEAALQRLLEALLISSSGTSQAPPSGRRHIS